MGTGLASEMTFDLAEDIVRTVSFASSPTAGRALAFGDSSIYALGQDTQGWSLDVIEEYATPFAVYRINDSGDVHARIDRLGARCKIATFSGSLKAFSSTPLASGPVIDCPESGSPMAIGLDVVCSAAGATWSARWCCHSPPQSVGTTGAMVPSALKVILSMQTSRWFPSPSGIAQRWYTM